MQGLGSGVIVALTEIILADLVPLRERGAYQGAIGFIWSVASIIGPLVVSFLSVVLEPDSPTMEHREAHLLNGKTGRGGDCSVSLARLMIASRTGCLTDTHRLELASYRNLHGSVSYFPQLEDSPRLIWRSHPAH